MPLHTPPTCQDKILRELDASLVVADAQTTLWLMGNGDVLEGCDGVMAIGSGADYAESAARALLQLQQDGGSSTQATGVSAAAAAAPSAAAQLSLFDIALAAMRIAADCCIYTNTNFSYHHITPGGEILSGSSSGSEQSLGAGTVAAPGSDGGVS